MYDSECQQKHARGDRCQHDQGDVDSTVQALPAAAVVALYKVLLVVAAHFRRQPGNVVAPACQDFPHKGVNALLSHTSLHSYRIQRHGLRSQHDAVAEQRLPGTEGTFRCSPGNRRMVVLLR